MIAAVTVIVAVVVIASAGAFVLTRRDDPELMAAQARSALLLADEVGIGYEDSAPFELVGDGADEEPVTGDPACLDELDTIRPGDPTGAAELLFGSLVDETRSRSYASSAGAQVYHGVDEDGGGTSALALIRRILEACPSIVTDEIEIQIGSRPAIELGDDAVSFALTSDLNLRDIFGESDELTASGLDLDEPLVLVMVVTVWARGEVVSTLVTGDAVSGPQGLPLGDPDRIDDLARKADDKLLEVIEEAG